MSAIEVTADAPRPQLAPVDTSVKLPASVLAAAARAEELHRQSYQKPDAPAPQPGETPPVAGEAAQPQPADTQVQPAPQPAPQPAQVTAPVTSADPAPQPQEPVDEGSYEHKFKSQQGRLAAQNRTLQQMQQQMMEMGNELVAARQALEQIQRAPQPQPQHQQRQPLITDKDVADYGEDFLNVAARAATQVISPEIDRARAEAQAARQEINEIKIESMYTKLGQAVPQWQKINRHPSFNAWLSLRDPMSGVIRKSLLDGAYRSANAGRVISIFQGFLAEDAASRPAEPAPPAQPAPTAPAARAPAVPLENLAAPGRARSAQASPPPADKPVYNRADFINFARAVTRGVYAGREAEKNAIEADMHAAQFDGRIRG